MNRRSRNRGLTILEAVLATVILAMVATALSATIATAQKSSERNKLRLHAYEAANRVILQWLDDESDMPTHHYHDGTYQFFWEIEELPLIIENPQGSARIPPTEGQAVALLSAQKLLAVRVFEGMPDGIGGWRPGDLLAELRRTHNPLSVLTGRNPDSNIRITKNRELTSKQTSKIFGSTLGQTGGNSSSGSNTSSGSKSGGTGSSSTRPSGEFVGPGNPPKR